MNPLQRVIRPEQIRVPDDGTRTFEAIVLAYGVADDYSTVFDPGCAAESLVDRMPRITWAHSWSEPIGRWVDYTDTDETLTLIGELDDFAAVPRAQQAWTQLRSGTIDQFSVGFRVLDSYTGDDDLEHFRKITLDEAALVLVGAVPGTKLVSVRSKGQRREVPEEYVIDLAKKVVAGAMTKEEAQIAVDLAAGGETPPAPVEPVIPPEPTDDTTDLDADDALASLGLT